MNAPARDAANAARYLGPVTKASSPGPASSRLASPSSTSAASPSNASPSADASSASFTVSVPEQLRERRAVQEAQQAAQPDQVAGAVRVPEQLALRAQAGQHDRLQVAVTLEPQLAVHAADAALLAPAEGTLRDRVRGHAVVDHHAARLEPAREPLAPRRVTRPHARLQAVAAVVREAQRLVLVAHDLDRETRAERLLAHDQHLVSHVDQHRGLEEEPGVRRIAPPAGEHARTALDRVGHVALDDFELGGARDRAHVDLALRLGALAQLAGELDDPPDERLADPLRDGK